MRRFITSAGWEETISVAGVGYDEVVVDGHLTSTNMAWIVSCSTGLEALPQS